MASILLFVAILLVAVGSWQWWRSAGGRALPIGAVDESAFTILVLGGSTAWGEPYTPRADFGLIASWMLGGEIDGRPIRVVNLGGSGKPAADVVQDARRISRVGFEPGTAVALLYLGNNEFLAFDDDHDLRSQQRALFDTPTIDDEQKDRVLRNYAAHLDEIMRLLRDAGVRVIASNIAVNMKDWEPNRSVLRDAANGPVVKQLLAAGDRQLEAGDAESALAEFRRILDIEPAFALAWKRSGDCHRRLGHLDEARVAYQRAIDHDGNPYRETSEQDRILREICRRYEVPLVEATRILEGVSPEGLIGFEVMWDNCHPTLDGYARIAGGFVEEIERIFDVRRRHEAVAGPELERALGIDDAFQRRVLASRGQYCYLASTLTFDPGARLKRGEVYLRRALATAPDDPAVLCSLGILAALRGDGRESVAHWREAYRLDPQTTLERAAHPYVRQIMQRNGIDDLSKLLQP